MLSSSQASLGLGSGCTLLVGTPPVTLGASASALGFAEWPYTVPSDLALRGQSLYAQVVALDAAGPFLGLALSRGLKVTLGD